VPISPDATPYLASRRGTPFDRLEALQEALRTLAGAGHLAPVHGPSRILDVGGGLSHWLREIGAEFPAALRVGAGSDPSSDGGPQAAGAAVRADLGLGLPFVDGAFDFVHHRVIPFAVREELRFRLLDELVRMLAPGAWIEIVATEPAMVPMSPATEVLLRQVRCLLDLNPDRQARWEPLAGRLRARGLTDVVERRFELPIGSWGGPVGAAMLSNFRAVMGAVASALEANLRIPTLDTLEVVARSTEEIEERQTVAPVWFVWGRLPRWSAEP
jgi:hypothetical protein